MFQNVEELTLNHWQSLQTVLYDGWVLRFADGYTKRANSVNPIYRSTIPTEEKIAECEHIYSSRNLPTVFKITPFVCPHDLDSTLEQKGYALVEPSLVKNLDLAYLKEPLLHNVKIEDRVSSEWIEGQFRLSNMSDNALRTLPRMINNILASKVFISLYESDQLVSSGFGVMERGYVGLYNIVTAKEHRNKGYGEQLFLNLLNFAKECGATHSYLQVVADNQPAIKLYTKLGYREIYKYWYRVKRFCC